MKSVKIEVPQGYEIDKEKSTFENIVFKEVKIELPKTWKELEVIKGWWVNTESKVLDAYTGLYDVNKNVFATKEQAQASIALAQLSQLREVYRNGWVPNWSDNNELKYCIYFVEDKTDIVTYCETNQFLSFQDVETRDLFLENFKDLIEQAKPLLS